MPGSQPNELASSDGSDAFADADYEGAPILVQHDPLAKFKVEDCVTCDFQLSTVCNPTRDIASFAVLNLDVAERRSWLTQLLTYYYEELAINGITEYPINRMLEDIPKWLCWPLLMDMACANGLRLFCEEYKRKKAAGEAISAEDERRWQMNDRHRQRLFSALLDFKTEDYLQGLRNDVGGGGRLPFFGCCCLWAMK